jgi:hypothetical protein
MKNTKFGFITASLFIGLGSILFLNNSCQHEGIPADQFPSISFKKQIVPIFQNTCGTSGCHDANSNESEYNYADPSGADILKSVVPYDATKSKAYQAITSTFQIMPPDGSLSTNQRTLIRLWIDQGAVSD